ncbi:hypothetical protein L596_030722 [Steinernema carpocapsae]|uniref:Uncharacterized protein n=1 Tax=Steinernema carpocapsae TaxID=34508 RepID=A0A4U5LNM4_STECR|nr:hypothetical protein L596_030722 [Steinernema carpocapsae]
MLLRVSFGQVPCNTEGVWTQWEYWSDCPLQASVPQFNVQRRVRTCQITPEGCVLNNSYACSGTYVEVKNCTNLLISVTSTRPQSTITFPGPPCNPVGQWDEWGSWDQCPIIAFLPQYNVQRRVRTCHIVPQGCADSSGFSCSGSYADVRTCKSTAKTPVRTERAVPETSTPSNNGRRS